MFSRNPPYAMRATLISTDILKRRSMHSDAAMQFLKMITEVSTDCTHSDQLSQWVGQFAHYAARHLLQVITVVSTLYLDAGTQLFMGLGLWWETRNITQQIALVYFTDIDGRPEISPNRLHWCILLTLNQLADTRWKIFSGSAAFHETIQAVKNGKWIPYSIKMSRIKQICLS